MEGRTKVQMPTVQRHFLVSSPGGGPPMSAAPDSFQDMPREKLLALIDLLMCRPCLTRKDLAMRYGRDLRSIDRYKAAGTLPKPIYFHGPLWTPLQIVEAESNPALQKRVKPTGDKVANALQREFILG